MGHSPQMTVRTYAHVIRELKGEPRVSAEEQIERARREVGGPWVDVNAVERRLAGAIRQEIPAYRTNSSAWIRTRDLTIMSRAL